MTIGNNLRGIKKASEILKEKKRESRGYRNSNTIKDLLDAFFMAKGPMKDVKRTELITEILKTQFDGIEKYNIHYHYNDEFPVLVDENGDFYVEKPEYKRVIPVETIINGKNEIIFKAGTGKQKSKAEGGKPSNSAYAKTKERKKGGPNDGSEARRLTFVEILEEAKKDPTMTADGYERMRNAYRQAMITTNDD